jgi:hypothetical protein
LSEIVPPEFFADTVIDLLLVNGVYRLTLAKQGANKEFSPAVRIFIPAAKLAAVLRGVERASDEILGKLQAQTDGRNLEGETMVQMPEEDEEPPAEAPADEAEESKGALALGKKLMRKVAAKARTKKTPKKTAKTAPKKAAAKKESAAKTKKAPKGKPEKDSKKKR